MSLFVWDDTYSVKVKQFDSEHQKLFDIINELYDGMKAGHGQQALASVIQQLISYTEKHFSSEEAALRRANYPQLEQQITQHRAFVARIKQLSQDFASVAAGLSVEVLDFLKDWLANHIKGTDRQYSTALNANGIR